MTKALGAIESGLITALAYAKGEEVPGIKVHTVEVVDVKAIRKKTGLTQPEFSKIFMVPVGTLRNWEQGRHHLDGAALALLRIIDTDPKAALKKLLVA